ncbi:hypothetical protein R9C00_23030 [Flammeovirgaceae bacterium SG7u.111]|nr:hypothetical protein [Flammeovirgaceae bacterium SG7u.132]WPO34579.1 hypothetical protein R9C00_23030 [Flammeovirgaceae bacterium SG7u.111]
MFIKYLKYLYFTIVCLCASLTTNAQQNLSSGFLYGKVTLNNGEHYEGQLRWENEQAMWGDLFNAIKLEPPYHDAIDLEKVRSQQNNDSESGFDMGFMKLWEDRAPQIKYYFKCQFGALLRIRSIDSERAEVLLKDRSAIQCKNFKGDLNKGISIFDRSVGLLEFDWETIKQIDFISTPSNVRSSIGKPLYGKVLTNNGSFEGFITWDMEERTEDDLIDGYMQGGTKVTLLMKDIQKIQSERDGSMITLKSGRKVFLGRHDDVGKGNHGIVIRTKEMGNIKVAWNSFISVKFFEAPHAAPSYDEFPLPTAIRGQVTSTEGKSYEGRLLFDLDESIDAEVLDGENDDFSYFIPFNLIASLIPENYNYTLVELKNGTELLLGKRDDVTYKNLGILIWEANKQPVYIPFKNVRQVLFK